MATIDIGLAIPDLKIFATYPCSAVVAPPAHGFAIECGATPASMYRRYCTTPSHERVIWLCPVHASVVAANASICRECAEMGGVSPVMLFRLTEPVRIP
jgi:hypothetical protein